MISVTITTAELEAHNACTEGLELFHSWFPGGTWHVPGGRLRGAR